MQVINLQNPYFFIIALSAMIIASALFLQISKKTRIPSVLLLIGLGIGLSQILKVFKIQIPDLMGPLQVIGLVGLMVIVLEGALDLRLSRNKLGLIVRAFFSALLILAITIVTIMMILHLLLEMALFQSFVYAIPLSVVSSAIVIPSVHSLFPAKKEFLVYESTFSDILGIMLFDFTVLEPKFNIVQPMALSISLMTLLSIILGIAFTFLLLILIQRMDKQIKLFLFLSILAMVFAVGKYFHLPALLVILFFGIILKNSDLFFKGRLGKLADLRKLSQICGEFHLITGETSFLIRTFFFIFFGMTLRLDSLISSQVLLTGSLIIIAIYLIRYINLKFFDRISVMPQLLIAPRGLITVLLFYKIPAVYLSPKFNEGMIVFVILVTSISMMIGLLIGNRQKQPVKELSK